MSHHYHHIFLDIVMPCAATNMPALEQEDEAIQRFYTALAGCTASFNKYVRRSKKIQNSLPKKLKEKAVAVALLNRQQELLLYAPHKFLLKTTTTIS